MSEVAEKNNMNKRAKIENENDEININENKEVKESLPMLPPILPRKSYEPSLFNRHGLDCSVRLLGDFIGRYLGRPNIEIEAKLGVLIDKQSSARIKPPVLTETILMNAPYYRFDSNMTEEEHKKFNKLLNDEFKRANLPSYNGSVINYEHLYEKDVFYKGPGGTKIRVTFNTKTDKIVDNGIITKVKLDQLDFFSPQTRMDFRISINDERKATKPTTVPEHERVKDRLSYKHELFRVDLTQVKAQPYRSAAQVEADKQEDWEKTKVSHELEVEILDLAPLHHEFKLFQKGLPNQYYTLIQIFLTNVRLLARASNRF